MYVPYIANAVLTGNAGGKNAPINIQGILIGNGLGGDTDNDNEMTRRSIEFFYGHAAYSYQQQLKIDASCDWNGTLSNDCNTAIDDAAKGIGDFYMSVQSTTTRYRHSVSVWPLLTAMSVCALRVCCAATTSTIRALTTCWL